MKKNLMMAAGCALALGTFCAAPVSAGGYFHKTELEMHMDFERDKGFGTETDILTATVNHFSEWKYGDNFFFFDVEGKDDYKLEAAQYYGEFASRFSLDKIILGADKGNNLLGSFLKESYIKLEYNGGSPVSGYDYIDDALLYGVSFDLDLGQPNFGFTNLSFLVKDFTAIDGHDNSETNWQVTLVWGQPFSLGSMNFTFQGFFDVWEYNDEVVVLTEPQIRLQLNSFVGKDNFLSDSAIGMEFEFSNRFFDQGNSDWYVNPTVFWVTKF
jgi:nucleoside-specific outer membrane channel protein Tsx